MRALLHWFGLHKWSKWGDPEEAEKSNFFEDSYTIMVQIRVCTTCNKQELRNL
jgi:hypothetical protein